MEKKITVKSLKDKTLPDHKIVERGAPRLLLLNDQAIVDVGGGLADGPRDPVFSDVTENSWNLFPTVNRWPNVIHHPSGDLPVCF